MHKSCVSVHTSRIFSEHLYKSDNLRPLQDRSGQHPTKTLWFPKVIGKRSSRPRGGLALRVRGDLLPFDGDGGATLSLVQDGSYHPPTQNLHFAPDRCLRWKWTKTTHHFFLKYKPPISTWFNSFIFGVFSIVFVSCIRYWCGPAIVLRCFDVGLKQG